MRITRGQLLGVAVSLAIPGAWGQTTDALPTLYLIGDSTVKNSTKGQQGWGDPVAHHFDTAKIHVVNRARGGRSSRTFLTEGLWDATLKEAKPGDFLVMQFGHNDGGPLVGPKARGSLKGNGDNTQEVTLDDGRKEIVHSYGWYLRHYITTAKAQGVHVIVVSPVPRNIWREGKVSRASGDYGKWAMEAAKATGVLFIDLNEIIATRYEGMGQEKVQNLFTDADHTHTSPAGAVVNAEAFIAGVRQHPDFPLNKYVKP